ncbi:unnamed protein product [Fusarium fujikuroi]|uniref:Uncharacterized protein n=1 Tax=Fusarium fujikuroi TaxID=5127 RepID=A0A2H3RBX9_FUSFU|nr:uncharacterized protein FFC1_02012 [Fusarium fujikuroi]SCO08582.1 uncharacterized protein FFE2_11584 [Fusarium fujikuroi]SCO47582.1 uncharacterized protein FFNC_11648 [Fusarium fujikuroi]VTT62390.1 unnamed protein product [Fusarium fujikuroi]VZH90793.1 unnamed protein product [Fusarium fujikuroi]
MADKITRGAWFNPIVIDDDEPVKLEDNPLPSRLPLPSTLHLSNTLHLPNGPPVTNGPPLFPCRTRPIPAVRFGTMRTRNQLCRLLQEFYNNSPAEFHRKVDRAYAQFLHKFSTTQQSYLRRIQPVFDNGNCFSGFSQVYPSATLTQLMQMVLHAEKRQTWVVFHV